jgi:hypothetical protein
MLQFDIANAKSFRTWRKHYYVSAHLAAVTRFTAFGWFVLGKRQQEQQVQQRDDTPPRPAQKAHPAGKTRQ